MRHEENALLGRDSDSNFTKLLIRVVRIVERKRYGVEENRSRFRKGHTMLPPIVGGLIRIPFVDHLHIIALTWNVTDAAATQDRRPQNDRSG